VEAAAVELRGDGERALAADGDQSIDAESFEVRDGLFEDRVRVGVPALLAALDEAAAVARAQHGAAAREQPAHVLRAQLARPRLVEQAVEAVLDADDAQAVLACRGLHHRANHRVQPRRVAAPRHQSDCPKHRWESVYGMRGEYRER
jgi:hypothetical protein